jgi:hypothetical protein
LRANISEQTVLRDLNAIEERTCKLGIEVSAEHFLANNGEQELLVSRIAEVTNIGGRDPFSGTADLGMEVALHVVTERGRAALDSVLLDVDAGPARVWHTL